MIRFDPVSRRHFLFSAGGLALSLPLLPSLLGPHQALATGAARRFIFIHNGHGHFDKFWFPQSGLNFSNIAGGGGRVASLGTLAGNVSTILGAPFTPYKSKMNLFQNLDYTSSTPNHSAEALLMGGALSQSGSLARTLDHVLCEWLSKEATRKSGRQTTISPLLLTNYSYVTYQSTSNTFTSVKGGKVIPGAGNPSAVFASLFGATATTTDNTTSATENTQRLLLQKKAVDHAFQEYKALKGNPRLSALDAKRLEEHMNVLSELQDKVYGGVGGEGAMTMAAAPVPASCQSPTGPSSSPLRTGKQIDFDTTLNQMIDVTALAVSCGKAPVVNLMMHPYDYFPGDSMKDLIGLDGDPHTSFGHGGTEEGNIKMHQYYAQKVARLLNTLSSMQDPEGGGTMLDTSIVMWGNDMGAAPSPGHHSDTNLPIVLFGSGAGALRTGNVFDYGMNSPSGPRGRPLNQLLVSILKAMGVPASEYETAPGAGFGFYGEITSSMESAGAQGHKTNPLPGLLAAT